MQYINVKNKSINLSRKGKYRQTQNIAFSFGHAKRDTSIDAVKGIGIIFMVWGHAYGPFKHWIYLFHMAIFFIASGILWDDKKADDIRKCKEFFIKKMKTLWLPFVLCNGFFNLMHNLFLKTGIYTDNVKLTELVKGSGNYVQKYRGEGETFVAILKNFFFAGGSQLGGATWFLRTLFCVSVIYMGIIYVSNQFNLKKYIIPFSAVICMAGAEIVSRYKLVLPLGIHCFFAAYLAFLSGVTIHNMDISDKIFRHRYKILAITLLLLCLLNNAGSINMSSGNITNPLFFLAVSVLGWFMLYSIASCQCIKENRLLVFIGQHTLGILLFHLLAFKIVTWAYIFFSNEKKLLLAAFPVIKNVAFLWLPYTVIGIAIPLMPRILFNTCKNICRKERQ